jgi:aspartate-semialdehyde dehydrogenase
MKKIKVAILGCSGLVGRQFARLLDDHPYFTLSCLSASPRSRGKRYSEVVAHGGEPAIGEKTGALVIRETSVATVMQSGARVVFSALPAAVAGDLELELRRNGVAVFSNASSHRMDPLVPLLVPEANAEHLELAREQLREFPGFIVTNSNCSVAGLALALKPLTAFSLRAVVVTTFQAVSGAGRRGVAAWDILGNVIPYIGHEEEKVARETKKILGRLAGGRIQDHELDVFPSCSRVPVLNGHLLSVSAEFPGPIREEALAEAFSGFRAEPQQLALPTAPQRPLLLHGNPDRPQPLLDSHAGEPERARGMAVSVGRLRCARNRCRFFLLVHNTVRGAAGGCVLNAELALKRKLLRGG